MPLVRVLLILLFTLLYQDVLLNQIAGIVVNGNPTVSIDLAGSACVNSSTQLQALVSGGNSPFTLIGRVPMALQQAHKLLELLLMALIM